MSAIDTDLGREVQLGTEGEGYDPAVHPGDIFDHHNIKDVRKRFGQEFNRTIESDIPFYYVYGNHLTSEEADDTHLSLLYSRERRLFRLTEFLRHWEFLQYG